jgi:hypothetical protein
MSAREAATNYSYFPYLPALVVAGIPRALVGRHWFTDARCWMLAIEGALAAVTARRLSPRARAGFLALIASPVVTLLVAAGGHDVFIASFLVLGALGVAAALGGAVSMSLLAWPLAAPFGFVPRFDLRRIAVAAGVLAITGWPVLVDPGAAWANLVRFPAGDTPARSPADAPSIGRALRHVPGGSAITALLLVGIVVALAVSVVRRPPATVGDAAGRAALAFLALAVTVPATRTGYLVHPLALGVLWWAELPSGRRRRRTSRRRLHSSARPPDP